MADSAHLCGQLRNLAKIGVSIVMLAFVSAWAQKNQNWRNLQWMRMAAGYLQADFGDLTTQQRKTK